MKKPVIIIISLFYFEHISPKCITFDNSECSSYELTEEEKQKDIYGNIPDTCCLVKLNKYNNKQVSNDKFCYPLPINSFKDYVYYFNSKKEYRQHINRLNSITIKCGDTTYNQDLRKHPAKPPSSIKRTLSPPEIPPEGMEPTASDIEKEDNKTSTSSYIIFIKLGLLTLLFLYYLNLLKIM